jgi:putative transferase (TIGR04331 family)
MQLITFSEKLLLFLKRKKKIKNNFFIGEWCLEEKSFEQLKKSNFIDVYEWNNNKEKDIKYLNYLYRNLLVKLSNSLNKYHKKKKRKKYWEQLVSRWLWLYLLRTYSIWEISKKALKKYKIKSIPFFNFKNNIFVPENSDHARNIIQSEESYWSHWIFTKIFKLNNNIKFIELSADDKINFVREIKYLNKDYSYDNMVNFYFFKRNYFFYKFYIPKKFRIKLMLKNLFINIKISISKIVFPDVKIDRNNFYNFKKGKDKFMNFLNEILPQNFPKSFLENYDRLEKSLNKLNWPKNVKYIFTTHGHYFDDLFKLYVAKQRDEGSKFIIAQHGYGGFFNNNNFYNILYDYKVCDRYASWGGKKNRKTSPLFINTVYKKSYNNKIKFYPKKKILLELYQLADFPQRPPNGYLGGYQRNKLNIYLMSVFFKKLRKDILLRMHAKILNVTKKHVIENYILKKFPQIKFLKTNKFIHKIRKGFNLQVGFFLGGGFFEAIYLNNPVILIFENKFTDGINDEMKKYLFELEKVNICFKSPKEAALFININYETIDKWWNSENVQQARKNFCNRYCKHSIHPVEDFQKIFN